MLTADEKRWLERRKVLCTHCDLIARDLCQGHNKTSCSHWDRFHCNNPVKRYKAFQDMQDAAEFEARVAEKLAIDRATGKHLRPKGCSWYETAKDGQRIRQTACPPHHDIDKCAGFATSQPRLRWTLDTGPGLRHGGGTTTHGSVRAAVSKPRASCPAFCAGFSFFSC